MLSSRSESGGGHRSSPRTSNTRSRKGAPLLLRELEAGRTFRWRSLLLLASLLARLAPLAPRSGRTAGFPRPEPKAAAASSRPARFARAGCELGPSAPCQSREEPPLLLLRAPVGLDRVHAGGNPAPY